jgi:hypothetical protein
MLKLHWWSIEEKCGDLRQVMDYFRCSGYIILIMALNEWNRNSSCRILGSHSGGYEEYHLLGYNAV